MPSMSGKATMLRPRRSSTRQLYQSDFWGCEVNDVNLPLSLYTQSTVHCIPKKNLQTFGLYFSPGKPLSESPAMSSNRKFFPFEGRSGPEARIPVAKLSRMPPIQKELAFEMGKVNLSAFSVLTGREAHRDFFLLMILGKCVYLHRTR